MLLRNRKTQGEEKNWCLILSPLRSEIDKKRVSQKIADAFHISTEEATDLVANTPIILLDNLSRPMAVKLKEYFVPTGADLLLTNDVFQKRKCYRTVWPEQPNLTFLHNWSPLADLSDDPEALRPDDALNEIRSITKEEKQHAPVREIPSEEIPSGFGSLEREQLLDDAERSRREAEMLREECRKLQDEIRQMSHHTLSGEAVEMERNLREKEKENKDLKVLLSNSEEKYGVLKEEYRESRTLYEEKLSTLGREIESVRKKAAEAAHAFENTQKEKQRFQETSGQKDVEIQRLQVEYEKTESFFREKLAEAMQQAEKKEIQAAQLLEKVSLIEKEKEAVRRDLAEKENILQGLIEKVAEAARQAQDQEARSSQLAEKLSQIEKSRETLQQEILEYQKVAGALKEKISEASHEAERQDMRIRQLTEKSALLEKAKETLEQTLNEQTDQIAFWNEKNRQLTQKQEFIEKAQQDEKALREKVELRLKDLEKSQLRLIEEVESRTRESKEWEEKCLMLETQVRELAETNSNQEKILQSNYRQLEMRDKELENTRRQLREINSQLEQREAIQKRTRLASELTEKEGMLKRLVVEQEKVEAEIREREEAMRKILSEQEKVEKEIIEGKQAQRHLTEQLKRSPLNKTNKPGKESEGAEEEPGPSHD